MLSTNIANRLGIIAFVGIYFKKIAK